MNDLEQIVGFRLLNGTQQAYLLNPEVNTAPQVSRIRVQALLGETVGLKFVRTHTDVNGDTLSIFSGVLSPGKAEPRFDVPGLGGISMCRPPDTRSKIELRTLFRTTDWQERKEWLG